MAKKTRLLSQPRTTKATPTMPLVDHKRVLLTRLNKNFNKSTLMAQRKKKNTILLKLTSLTNRNQKKRSLQEAEAVRAAGAVGAAEASAQGHLCEADEVAVAVERLGR